MYVCMHLMLCYVSMYVCLYVCMSVCKCACRYSCICIHTYVHTYMYTYIQTDRLTDRHIHIYAICLFIYVCTSCTYVWSIKREPSISTLRPAEQRRREEAAIRKELAEEPGAQRWYYKWLWVLGLVRLLAPVFVLPSRRV